MVSNAVLQAIALVVNTVMTILVSAMASHGIKVVVPPLNFPRDVRTAYARYFAEPDLKRSAACPTCFYPVETRKGRTRPTCRWKASPRSRKCGAALWKSRRTCSGEKSVPSCLVTTQSLRTWLPSFTSRKVIDDALHKTYQEQAAGLKPEMRDVHDSPGWREMYGGGRGPYDLVFGLYIDWYQVFKLKIAGEEAVKLIIQIKDLHELQGRRHHAESSHYIASICHRT